MMSAWEEVNTIPVYGIWSGSVLSTPYSPHSSRHVHICAQFAQRLDLISFVDETSGLDHCKNAIERGAGAHRRSGFVDMRAVVAAQFDRRALDRIELLDNRGFVRRQFLCERREDGPELGILLLCA